MSSPSFYRKKILPRVAYIPYFIIRILPLPFALSRRRKCVETKLCIEAGARGWESIEFKELYASAVEYLGEDQVEKVVIVKDKKYLRQILDSIREQSPTHYVYDPRTGSQNWWAGLLQAFFIHIHLHARGIIPIVILTDLGERLWRVQSAMVSAKRGIVITFISARKVSPIFPHRRLIGPCLMPFSIATLFNIKEWSKMATDKEKPFARFVGSLYEPRTSILNQIASKLRLKQYNLEIIGRKAGEPRIPDSEYWFRIINAPIIITTTDQIIRKEADWTWIPQLVYRYLEVAASGTLLIAQDLPGVQRFFTPGVHYATFTTAEEGVDAICYFIENPEERRRIANAGQQRANALISSRIFWTITDTALGTDSLT